MGLSSSAQSFQRLLDSVLEGLDNCFCYLDDVMIYSKNKQDHIKTLNELFKRLDDAGLAISLDKCQFGKESIESRLQS